MLLLFTLANISLPSFLASEKATKCLKKNLSDFINAVTERKPENLFLLKN